MSTRSPEKNAVWAMYAGIALTALATLVSFSSTGTLEAHIKKGYPDYTAERVAETLDAYNMLFATVAVLAAACWLWSIWVVKKNKSWARWAISASFLAGLTVALAMVFIRDESGDVGVPTELSLLYLLPCVAGLATVVLVWRREPSRVTA